MNELALFAGAGGGILGGKLLGWTTVCGVEINSFCARRLMQRQNEGHIPPFPIWDDVCTFDGKPWRGIVDVVSGGFPCQDISSAGKGAGIEGKQSKLWKHMARIIEEIRPRFAFVENSPLLVGRGLAVLLSDFAEMGYDAQWGVVGTSDIGGNCEGERIWIAASPSKIGRGEMVCCKKDIRRTSGKRWPAAYAYPCSRIDRIRALESVACEPAILGSNDGLANRLDRLHAIGNGQNPFVAAKAWESLIDS